jgi:hypothetical protein
MDTKTPRRRRALGAVHRYAELRVTYALATPAERVALLPQLAAAWKTVERELDAFDSVPKHVARERTEEIVDVAVTRPGASSALRRAR